MPRCFLCFVWSVLGLILPVVTVRAQADPRVVLLVPTLEAPSWQDDAYLCGLAAAARLGEGVPLALAVDAAAPWRPELLNFLRRLQPRRLLWIGEAASPPPERAKIVLEQVPARSALEAAIACARLGWDKAPRVVLYDAQDRSAALAAATLAARLREPLFPITKDAQADGLAESCAALGVERALWIGSTTPPSVGAVTIETIVSAEAVVAWMVQAKLPVDYLAAVNPLEATGRRSRHLVLAAPLLAAARQGAVAALPSEVRWKSEHLAPEILKEAPPGAAQSSSGWRRGMIGLKEKDYAFITSRDPSHGELRVQIDCNADGRFDGASEGALGTGQELELAGSSWTISLHAEEKATGEKLWITTPSASSLRGELARYRRAAAKDPAYLCLVGWPQSLPMAIVDHGQGIDIDLVSDLPLAQYDDDLFAEPAYARFIAEDLASATLLACRGFVRERLSGSPWRGRFATAEWAEPERPNFASAGLAFAGHHPGQQAIAPRSPLCDVDLIVHSSHAMWTEIGQTYSWNTETLLAPALVISAGCSTASLDQDAAYRSAPARVLRNGAVAFAGNGRRGIAQSAFFLSSFWNALQTGDTLGAAHRRAANHTLVTMLDHDEQRGGSHYYQAYHQTVFGDPALDLGYASKRAPRAARTELVDQKAIVHGPAKWILRSAPPLEEWQCKLPQIYSWHAAGVAVESRWNGEEKRDEERYFVVAEARVPTRVTGIAPIAQPAEPLGWRGGLHIDDHEDGTRSLYWRVRILDGDAHRGKVRAQLRRAEFRLLGP